MVLINIDGHILMSLCHSWSVFAFWVLGAGSKRKEIDSCFFFSLSVVLKLGLTLNLFLFSCANI